MTEEPVVEEAVEEAVEEEEVDEVETRDLEFYILEVNAGSPSTLVHTVPASFQVLSVEFFGEPPNKAKVIGVVSHKTAREEVALKLNGLIGQNPSLADLEEKYEEMLKMKEAQQQDAAEEEERASKIIAFPVPDDEDDSESFEGEDDDDAEV